MECIPFLLGVAIVEATRFLFHLWPVRLRGFTVCYDLISSAGMCRMPLLTQQDGTPPFNVEI